MALLKTMPADNIDNIELITNPAAKYDADGNAGIIDIRLKKMIISAPTATSPYLPEQGDTIESRRVSG
jgi:hypothetical protein